MVLTVLKDLGHFLLEQLLLPALRASKGKLVHVASYAAYYACEQYGLQKGCVDNITILEKLVKIATVGQQTNYGMSKFMMVYNARELAKRETAQGSGVRAYSIRPGFVATPMTHPLPPATVKAWCSP